MHVAVLQGSSNDPFMPPSTDPFVPSREEALGRLAGVASHHAHGPIQPVAVHQALGAGLLPPAKLLSTVRRVTNLRRHDGIVAFR